MNSWEEQWNRNKALALVRTRTQGSVSRFGADPSVHYVSPQPITIPQSSSGGSFSNGVLLVLAGFATGTLFGESWINKLIGEKHK